jgi:hypothetical protein
MQNLVGLRIAPKKEIAFELRNGFDAMGYDVPDNRASNAYSTVKSMIGCDTETAMRIVRKCCLLIKKDKPYDIVGAITTLDKDIALIDLTGRYRLLAVLLND